MKTTLKIENTAADGVTVAGYKGTQFVGRLGAFQFMNWAEQDRDQLAANLGTEPADVDATFVALERLAAGASFAGCLA
jgi:hypothetical protein